jgi:phosphatidylglycerophosphate synthase
MNNYFNNVKTMQEGQNFQELYSKIFSGKVSPYMAALFVGTKITPNQLTVAMIPLGILGGLMMAFGYVWVAFFGSLCFVLLNILDAVDGELARFILKTSAYGDYLDRVAHYLTNSAFVMGLGLFLFHQFGDVRFLYVMFACEIAIFGDEVVRDLLVTCGVTALPDANAGTRKKTKGETKIVSSPIISNVWKILFSNVAMFHLTPLLLLALLLFDDVIYVLALHYLSFSAIAVLKLGIRAKYVHRSIMRG